MIVSTEKTVVEFASIVVSHPMYVIVHAEDEKKILFASVEKG